MEFFERLKLEIEDIQYELKDAPVNISNPKVGDFGCGAGVTTLSLMLILQANQCIGIDKKDYDTEQSFSKLRDALETFTNVEEGSLQQDLQRLFRKTNGPVFQIADVLEGQNLPNGLDFAYCKRLLCNIYGGDYENIINGEEGVWLAISNITKTLKQGGIFCVVETMDFAPFFESIGLKVLQSFHFQRGEITSEGRSTSSGMIRQNFVCYYQKPKVYKE
jgi:SAM-dependent methyltransferase